MAIFNGKRLSALVVALMVALGLAACGTAGVGGAYGGGSTATTGGASSAGANLQCAAGAVVCTKTVSVSGKSETVLADTAGMTLYYFTPDTATTVACTGSCAHNWPPLSATSGGSVTGTGLSGALTALNGADGEQVEYNGHPLYTYIGDKGESDATGEGVLGKWFVATPTLSAGAAPAATPNYGY